MSITTTTTTALAEPVEPLRPHPPDLPARIRAGQIHHTDITHLADVADVRRDVRAAVQQWGATASGADAAEHVVSELVANAVHHGGGAHLRVCRQCGGVLILVRDTSPEIPAAPPADDGDLDAEHGRGLLLVAALAAAHGWRRTTGGAKTVWASVETGAIEEGWL